MSFKYDSPDDDVVWVEVPKGMKPKKGPGSEYVECI
jgi:hypothetical protein